MKKQVLSIGQCAFDHSNISRMLNENFDIEIQTAESHDEAMEKVRECEFDLILVNRLYDATGTPGIDTISDIKSLGNGSNAPVMLISNYEDAQDSAVAAGAVRGFGKNALSDLETAGILRDYLS